MAYYLGIDLGTTYTAAAIERDGLVEALTLGNRSASVPSVVFLRDDGEILVGEAATRRAMSEPGRVGREFKRRVGDPTPIILGGTPYAAEMLMARVLRWSVDRVQEQQGGPPQAIALTHPANWGPYKLDLLAQAVRQVDVDVAMVLPEPVAAATFYASQRRLEPGAVVAVYDLGGGTFDAAMVRRGRGAEGFEVIGTPEGIERLGGIDFDEAVFAHVRLALGDALERLDPEEPASVSAMARLRQECIDAKEALSSDTDVSIPVLLPALQTEVRLTRSEFEDMIRPAINETIVALRRSIRSAGVSNDEISAVLLVGGSSRIPLVAQMVAAELGRPIAIDAHPKDAISFGAAIAVAQDKGKATPESVTTVLPDQRPPPPTMATGTDRPAPPRPGIVQPTPPGDPRPAPPATTPVRPAAGTAPGYAAAGRPAQPGQPGQGQTGPVGQPAYGRAGQPGSGSGNQPSQPNPGQPGGPAQPGRPAQPGQPAYGQQPAASGAGSAPGQVQNRTGQPGQPGQPGYGQAGAAGRPAATGPAASGQAAQARSGNTPFGSGQTAAGAPAGAATPGYAAQAGGTGYRPPGQTATSGGYGQSYGSGGYPAQSPSGSGSFSAQGGGGSRNSDRTTLLIAIGVVAVALFIILAALISRQGDEGAQSYNDSVRSRFVTSCSRENDRALCQCTIDKVARTVPFDDFESYSDKLDQNSSAPQPDWLVNAVESCQAEDPPVSS